MSATLPVIEAKLSTDRPERLLVVTPYLPAFPVAARKLGGSWDRHRQHWSFDPRTSDRVAALCRDLYGYDWITRHSTSVSTIRCMFPADYRFGRDDLYAFGRMVLKPTSYGLSLGDNVLLIDGECLPGHPTTIDLLDVPDDLIERQRPAWEKKGVSIEYITIPAQETLPRDPIVNTLPLDADPDVAEILRRWRCLSARTQGKLLDHLQNDLPGVR